MQSQMPYQQQAPAMAYVGVWPRALAVIIDAIIIGIIAGIINAITAGGSTDPGRIAVSGSISGILALIYFVVLEATMGATLGKRLLGLRVVKDDGSAIGWGGSIIRNILRIIDGLVFYLVGAIIIWNTQRRQRLGDILAHTVVVRARG